MSGEVENRWGAKRGAMLSVQVLAYALFVLVGAMWVGPMSTVVEYPMGGADNGVASGAISLTPGLFAPIAVLIAVVLIAFHAFWPFRATLIDRVIGLIAGALSLVCVAMPLLSVYGPSDAASVDPLKLRAYPMATWAAAVAGLLVVLTIISFGRQMARENRSHLIRALSHCVTGGAASISLSGWAFIPYIGAASGVDTGVFVAVVVVMALFALVLAVASVWWLGELDPDPKVRHPWIGVAMLPVMFYGLVVFAAALFLQLV